jgi:uncharacterized membrane protein
MDSDDGPTFFSRAIAVVVLVVVAVIALRLVVGFVAGILSALLWIGTIVALVVAFLWARRQLKAPRRDKSVKQSEAREVVPGTPAEDRVADEMRRIQQQLREQGRG